MNDAWSHDDDDDDDHDDDDDTNPIYEDGGFVIHSSTKWRGGETSCMALTLTLTLTLTHGGNNSYSIE